jgi:gag-polypeptide of LTR copia-type
VKRLNKELNNCIPGNASREPNQWIQKHAMGNNMSEMTLIIHVLHYLPSNYETIVENLETELERDKATLERVKEKLRSGFKPLGKGSPKLIKPCL